MSTSVDTSKVFELAAELTASARDLPESLKGLQPRINELVTQRATTRYMSGGDTLNVRTGALRRAVQEGRATVRRKEDNVRFTKTVANLHGTDRKDGYTLTGVYARVHEFGSSNTGHGTPRFTTRARPYLAPALHDALPDIAEYAGDVAEKRLQAGIDRVAR